MFLAMIKRAVKATLHDASAEWAIEIGVPRAAVVQQRASRLALDAAARDLADDRAAAALGVGDDLHDATQAVLQLLTSSADDVTSGPEQSAPPGLPAVQSSGTQTCDDAALMAWVEEQRQAEMPWAGIACLLAAQGHAFTEEALRSRHRRWRDKNAQANQT